MYYTIKKGTEWSFCSSDLEKVATVAYMGLSDQDKMLVASYHLNSNEEMLARILETNSASSFEYNVYHNYFDYLNSKYDEYSEYVIKKLAEVLPE